MRSVGYEEGFGGQSDGVSRLRSWHRWSGADDAFERVYAILTTTFAGHKTESRIKTAGFVTEFGAVSDTPTGLAEVRFVANEFDGSANESMPLSWLYWIGIPPKTTTRRSWRAFCASGHGDIISHTFDASTGDFALHFRPNSVSDH